MPYKMNLPDPDVSILSQLLIHYKSLPENPRFSDLQQANAERWGDKANVAKCSYFHADPVQSYTEKTYQPYFEDKIYGLFILLTNVGDTPLAVYPPHLDQTRITSINYVLEPGGDDVYTSVYEQTGDYSGFGIVSRPNEVFDLRKEYKLNDPEWVAIDVQRYHSVRNIQHERVLYCLTFLDITLDEVGEKYKHLILDTI